MSCSSDPCDDTSKCSSPDAEVDVTRNDMGVDVVSDAVADSTVDAIEDLTPQPPMVAAELTFGFAPVKQVSFTWQDVDDATYYQVWEQRRDGDTFSQIGDDFPSETESFTFTAPLYETVSSTFKLASCNAVGCIDGDLIQVSEEINKAIGFFKPSNPHINQQFGTVAISADGLTLAVGARGEQSNATGIDGDQTNDQAANSGAVYIYTNVDDVWTQTAYIKASNTGELDRFGRRIGISGDGNVLVVAADQEDGSGTTVNAASDDLAEDSGAAFIFERMNGQWSQTAYLKASNSDADDQFGFRVAISGDGQTVAIGSRGEASSAVGVNGDGSDNTVVRSGAVYVFRRGADWTQEAFIKASNREENDFFGLVLSLNNDGSLLAASATGEDSQATGVNGDETDNSISGSGAVYLFRREAADWVQDAYLKASNTGAGDIFGVAMAMNGTGDTLVVGASREDGVNDSVDNQGAVYVFRRNGTTWMPPELIAPAPPYVGAGFGYRLSITETGDRIAAASGDTNPGIGAFLDPTGAPGTVGTVFLLTQSATGWEQTIVKPPVPAEQDDFGSTVALSADGRTLFVGASSEASDAMGVGAVIDNEEAMRSGAVYVY